MEILSGRGCCFGVIDVEREPSRPSVETLSRLSSLVRLAAEMEMLLEWEWRSDIAPKASQRNFRSPTVTVTHRLKETAKSDLDAALQSLDPDPDSRSLAKIVMEYVYTITWGRRDAACLTGLLSTYATSLESQPERFGVQVSPRMLGPNRGYCVCPHTCRRFACSLEVHPSWIEFRIAFLWIAFISFPP